MLSPSQRNRARSRPVLISLAVLVFTYGMMKKLAREEDPALFDQVTLGLIAAGLILSVSGLALAGSAARDARDRSSTDRSAR